MLRVGGVHASLNKRQVGGSNPTLSLNFVAGIFQSGSVNQPLGSILTYTRADATECATITDFEGVIRTVPANCVRLDGLRMVWNLYANSSTLGTQSNTVRAGSYTISIYGTGSVTFSGAATGVLSGTGVGNRVYMTLTTTAGTLTSTVVGSVTSAQLEDVTGQSVQTPGEYQSTGVLLPPYQGCGVDGINYYATKLDGSAIPGASGIRIEQSTTNLLLNSAIPVTQNIVTTAQSYTISHYGTGSVVLSGSATGTLNGTGANNRVWTTVTATAGTLTLTYSGSVADGQVEAGALLTSVVRTTGSTATRAADSALPAFANTGLTAAGGTVVIEFTGLQHNGAALARVLQIDDGTDGANRLLIEEYSTTGLLVHMQWGASGGGSNFKTFAVANISTAHKMAVAWDGTRFYVSVDGAAVQSASYTPPTGLSRFALGSIGGTANFQNGSIKSFFYYPTQRSDLQYLST